MKMNTGMMENGFPLKSREEVIQAKKVLGQICQERLILRETERGIMINKDLVRVESNLRALALHY